MRVYKVPLHIPIVPFRGDQVVIDGAMRTLRWREFSRLKAGKIDLLFKLKTAAPTRSRGTRSAGRVGPGAPRSNFHQSSSQPFRGATLAAISVKSQDEGVLDDPS
jgi:hypothetical protein